MKFNKNTQSCPPQSLFNMNDCVSYASFCSPNAVHNLLMLAITEGINNKLRSIHLHHIFNK
jgi:hypothetical protein